MTARVDGGRSVGQAALVFVLVLLVVAIGGVPARAEMTTARLALTPSAGPPTSHVVAAGKGFGASESIVVLFDRRVVATDTTTANGTFAVGLNVPASALPGSHTVTAIGRTSHAVAKTAFLV